LHIGNNFPIGGCEDEKLETLTMPSTGAKTAKPKRSLVGDKGSDAMPPAMSGLGASMAPASAPPLAPASPCVNLVVATPCFGGQISVLYAASLFKLQNLVRTYKDFNLKVLFKDGDALITRARASLISQFLDDPNATHLLFVDADIGFEPEQVLRLIESGADMSAAIYPLKRIDWGKVRSTIETGRDNPAAAALKYVFEVDDPNAVIQKGGFIKVRYAGTGFLMIRRRVLEGMCARYPQLRYKRDHSVDAATESDNRFALFECMIAEDGTYLSEDFAFCKRWIDMGGEIWADLKSTLSHVGPMTFHGDLSSQFSGEPTALGRRPAVYGRTAAAEEVE
jgi:hypothetical protein